MKTSKSEILYFFLSIIVLIGAGAIYVLYGNRYSQTSASSNSTTALVTTTSSTEATVDTVALEAAITAFEENPSDETAAAAQAALDQISDQAAKASLQARFDATQQELTNIKSAEAALTQAETSLSSLDHQTAQNAIAILTHVAKKAELQARLDAIIPIQ